MTLRIASLWLILLTAPALAGSIQAGDHLHFGRVSIEPDGPMLYKYGISDNKLSIMFQNSQTLFYIPELPRNVSAIITSDRELDVMVSRGARAKVYRAGNRLIIDVFDPSGIAGAKAVLPIPPEPPLQIPSAASSSTPGQTESVLPAVKPPPPVLASEQAAAARCLETPATVTEVAPAIATEQDPLVPLPVTAAENAPRTIAASFLTGGKAGVLLPFPAGTGAAAFQRGDVAVLVFDASQPHPRVGRQQRPFPPEMAGEHPPCLL